MKTFVFIIQKFSDSVQLVLSYLFIYQKEAHGPNYSHEKHLQ